MKNDNPVLYYLMMAFIIFIVKFIPSLFKSEKVEIKPKIDNNENKGIIDFTDEKMQSMKSMMQMSRSEFKYPPDWEERKWYIKQRDGNKCTICGSQFSLHVHHKFPVFRGPNHSEQNLITLCIDCHSEQGGPGHHNLVTMNTERYKQEKMVKYGFKNVIPRKDYNCTLCNGLIRSGSDSYTKNEWSNNSTRYRNGIIPDSKSRLCIFCFLEYPKYRS